MGLSNFFDFDSKFILSNFLATAQGLNKDEFGLWEHFKLINGDYEGVNFPVIFKQESGKKLNDIVDTGWANLYLISERMRKILAESNLSGWKIYPIKLYDKFENEILDYHGFSVIGRCDPVDYTKSEIFEKRLIPTGPLVKYYKGKYIDPEKWDGSDFFSPRGKGGIYITEKAALALKKNKITNLIINNLSEVEVLQFALNK